MALAPGTRIGVYEIVAPLGEGGMGVVYRARDTRLDRDVALKLLPDAVAQDPERLARFEREAKTLASLNHPHIAHVYSVEESGATRALVMELVEGEDLSRRIARGPVPLNEALPLARQIAEALQAAHDAGIVHRDLKPANIKVRDDGAIKVLDFGLAKAMDANPSALDAGALANSPTITSPAMTMRGVILGTAAYMSPEQAKGKPVDKRTDVWAFGCVLFEMLTGHRAFGGDDVSDTLASVLRAEPDWAVLERRSSAAVTSVVRRCLTRDPRQRTHDIGDVRIQLDETTSSSLRPSSPRVRSPWLPALGGLAVGLVLASAAYSLVVSPPADAPVIRTSIAIPEGYRLYRAPNSGRLAFAISPDGRSLAMVLRSTTAQRQAFVRRLDDTSIHPIAGTEGALVVFWAPDSRRIGVMTTAGVKITDVSGATSVPVVTLPNSVTGSWGPNNQIIASAGPNRPLQEWTVGDTTAKSRPVTLDAINRISPEYVPGGRVIYAARIGSEMFLVGQKAGGAEEPFAKVDAPTVGLIGLTVRDGYLLLSAVDRSGRSRLTAQRFDSSQLQLSGESTEFATDVNQHVSASATGVLAYSHLAERQEMVWLDAQGKTLSEVKGDLLISNMDLSADDRLVALQEQSGIRVHDLVRGVTSVVTADGADPVWSPDGSQIAFARVNAPEMGIFTISANGGTARRIHSASAPVYVDGWSPDGKWLAGHVNVLGNGILIPTVENAKPITFGDGSGGAVDEARFSPDGKWLAYGANTPDTGNIFVEPMPPTGARWQVSVDGAAQPRWRADGKALHFLSMSGGMMAVDFDGQGAAPVISRPRELFPTGLTVVNSVDQYAVSRDGQRFLLRRPRSVASRDQIELVFNWPALTRQEPR